METMVAVHEDWVEMLAQQLRNDGLSAATVESYLSDIKVFSRFYLEANGQEFHPTLLTSMDLREFRAWSLEHHSPATWNRRMVALASLSDFAYATSAVNYNPFKNITRAEEVDLAPKWLSPTDYKKFMRVVEHQAMTARTEYGKRLAVRDQALVALMVYAGLRESEVADLEIGDVVLRDRSGQVTVRMGKGEKRRVVPLGREARAAVALWLELRGEGEGKLFTGKKNVPLTGRGIQKVVEGLATAAGVDCTPHTLRHTFAKRALDRGVKLTELQKLLGHTKLETTARYVVPSLGDLERAVEDL